jgi:Mycothiol maleylpyruvate isomerase N-terminal domain
MDAASTPPVTAADVELAVILAADALNGALDQEWRVPAGDLEWDCRETVEHMADDLFAYAGQLGPRRPPLETYVPFAWQRREGGPTLTIFTEADTENAGLVQVFEACGAFLSSLVATVPPGTRAWHSMGVGDPEGFAAMGVVEVLVHMRDGSTGRRRRICAIGCCTGCSRARRPARLGGRRCCGRRGGARSSAGRGWTGSGNGTPRRVRPETRY